MNRSFERVFVGLAVVAIVIGGAGQWEALGDGKVNFCNGLTRSRDRIILIVQDAPAEEV